MPDFVHKVRRFAQELRRIPATEIPAKLGATAKGKARAALETTLNRTGAGRAVTRRYRGRGIVLMFHEIHDDVDTELHTGCSPAQLRHWVEALRAAGREIVTTDEALRRLAEPDARPFAVLTFDDAYRDNLTRALPVLETLDAPLTLFAPTGMLTRDLYAWWLALRDLFKRHDAVEIEAMERRFECPDLRSKVAANQRTLDWIGADPGRAAAMQATFDAYRIDVPGLVSQYGMGEQELRSFAAHPLVTIGGHTTSHPWLARLEDAAAAEEIAANKTYLEGLLGCEVRHFAYPFGTQDACGQREAALAQAAGYRCSFTTRPGHLFPDHLRHPHLMPRENAGLAHQSRAAMASRRDGIHRALETRFGNPIATTA